MLPKVCILPQAPRRYSRHGIAVGVKAWNVRPSCFVAGSASKFLSLQNPQQLCLRDKCPVFRWLLLPHLLLWRLPLSYLQRWVFLSGWLSLV